MNNNVFNRWGGLVILVLLSVPLFYLGVYNGHTIGDDFAQYLNEALNIAQGHPVYQSGYIFNPKDVFYAPPNYPIGFPLLLTPVVWVYKLSFPPLYRFNSAIVCLLMVVAFQYFKRGRKWPHALLLTVVMGYCGAVLAAKQQLLSDLPCLFFVSLYFLLRTGARSSTLIKSGLLVLVSVMAMMVRAQAVLVPLSELGLAALCWLPLSKKGSGGLQLLKKESFKFPLLALLSIAIVYMLNNWVFRAPVQANQYYSGIWGTIAQRNLIDLLRVNFVELVRSEEAFFSFPSKNEFHVLINQYMATAGCILVVIGFVSGVRKRIKLEDVFFLANCLMILCYPLQDHRYFLPVLVVSYSYAAIGLHQVLVCSKSTKKSLVLGGLFFLIFLNGFGYYKELATTQPPGLLPRKEDEIAFEKLQKIVGANDIIVFNRPRFLTLFTDRKAVVYASRISPEENKKTFDSLGVRYYLVFGGMDAFSGRYLTQTQPPLDSSRLSNDFVLYRLR